MELLYVFKGAFSVEVHYIPSWFLITLFFAGLMLYWLESSNKKLIVIETLILIIISIIGCRILDGMEEGFVRNILIFVSRIAISSVFMLIGVLWRRFDTSRINKPVVTVNCLIVTALFPLFVGWESISSFSINYISPFLLTGITGTCVVVAISKHLKCMILRFLGKESLVIMGTHQAVMYALQFRFPEIYSSTYVIVIYLIGVMVLEAIAIPVFTRYVPFLIGKQEFPFLKKYHSN